MAKLILQPLDPLLKKLEQLGRLDDVAPKMVDAMTHMVMLTLRAQLQQHRQSGQLENSIKQVKAKKSKTGAFVGSVRAFGYDKYSKPLPPDYPKGTPNAIKLAALEFGNSDQAATPVVKIAIEKSKKDALEYAQIIYEMEMSKDG